MLQVAPDLLGKRLVRGEVSLAITEVEAYFWPGDTACHARFGRTARTAAIFGPPGTAYVYLCYGIHHLLNLVTGPEGRAQAVLIRAAEVVEGLERVRERRGGRSGPILLTGPGKVGSALGLDVGWSGHSLLEPGGLEICDGPAPERILTGPRIGVDYAEPEHRDAPWRFASAGTRWVSHRRGLSPTP